MWVLAGILLQSTPLFSALCAVLWWSALLPKFNPFDAVCNRSFGHRAGAFHLTPAPAPRRTAQVRWRGRSGWRAHCFFTSSFRNRVRSGRDLFWPAVLALTLGPRSYITCWAGGERSSAKPCLGFPPRTIQLVFRLREGFAQWLWPSSYGILMPCKYDHLLP